MTEQSVHEIIVEDNLTIDRWTSPLQGSTEVVCLDNCPSANPEICDEERPSGCPFIVPFGLSPVAQGVGSQRQRLARRR